VILNIFEMVQQKMFFAIAMRYKCFNQSLKNIALKILNTKKYEIIILDAK